MQISTTTTTMSTSVDSPLPPSHLPHESLSPANLVIHRGRQAVSGDPGVHLQLIDNCANLSSDTPFAKLPDVAWDAEEEEEKEEEAGVVVRRPPRERLARV